MAIGLVLFALGPSPLLAVVAGVILGFGFSFPWSSVAASVLRKTSDSQRASAVGVLSAFYDLFTGMRRYTTLGLVWFDITQHQGIYHQDWRIEDSPEAEAAFRQGVRDKLTPVQPP